MPQRGFWLCRFRIRKPPARGELLRPCFPGEPHQAVHGTDSLLCTRRSRSGALRPCWIIRLDPAVGQGLLKCRDQSGVNFRASYVKISEDAAVVQNGNVGKCLPCV